MNAPVKLRPCDYPGFAPSPPPRWSLDDIVLALCRLGYADDPRDAYGIVEVADRGDADALAMVGDAEELLAEWEGA